MHRRIFYYMSTQPVTSRDLSWTLGDRIRKAVSVTGIPANKLAEALGVTRVTLSRWMNDATAPSVKNLHHMALVTGVPVEWLISGKLNETPPPSDGEGESVEPPTGFEPVTFSLQGDRNRPLSLVA